MFLPMLQFFNIDRFDFGSDVRKWNEVKKCRIAVLVLLREDSCAIRHLRRDSHDILYETPEFIIRTI